MPRFSKLVWTHSCTAVSTLTPTSLLLLPNTFAVYIDRTHSTTGLFSSLSYATSCEPCKRSRSRFGQSSESENGLRKDIRNGKHFYIGGSHNSTGDKPFKARRKHEAKSNQRETKQERHAGAREIDRQFDRPEFFDSSTQDFVRSSHLPMTFYNDLERVVGVTSDRAAVHDSSTQEQHIPKASPSHLRDQLQLLQSVRELEDKLSNAKSALDRSLEIPPTNGVQDSGVARGVPVLLGKQDYLNLVDLYYYSYQNRFEPGSPDQSPTPLFLDDYSFELSRDFSEPTQSYYNADEEDISPLRDVEEMLKSRQLKEISLMQAFVNVLLDDTASNRTLFEVYKMFPAPGVAYLPTGIIRLFLQRMSTPRQRSEKSMFRYLSLMDDMQKAGLRITRAEWSSAIYLAGRSFDKVTEGDVSKSFGIWREMEEGAGISATHVTFNILFDIAVRAEKHALAQNVLKEMHGRGLRLNRLGRVSLMYYHGLRGDGDGIRKTYRDFVEAGEIVDTLVLNCVMASLIKAQEPVAAEQIYERMKQLQTRLRQSDNDDGQEALFMKYPPPGSTRINRQMASNSLGRVLVNAARLRKVLPEHHQRLQASMPLTPDQITFRSLVSHHASTSGDLDRLTVLLNDKTDMFGLPLTSLDFQLLFKGFAVHGEARAEETWTVERLQLVWDACLSAIKAGQRPSSENRGVELPTVKDIDSTVFAPIDISPPKKADAWEEFVLDLAAFPRERLKRPISISNSFFPEDVADPAQPARTADIDRETEYSLPEAESLHQHQSSLPRPGQQQQRNSVEATRNLAIWLIRAYARCTRSRARIEDVWFQLRRLWVPRDGLEREAVVRVLRRVLRDCDHSGVM